MHMDEGPRPGGALIHIYIYTHIVIIIIIIIIIIYIYIYIYVYMFAYIYIYIFIDILPYEVRSALRIGSPAPRISRRIELGAVLRCFEPTAQQQTRLNIANNSSNSSSESRHDNDEVQSLSSMSSVAPTLRSWLPRRLRLSSAPNPAVLSPALLPATSRGIVACSASVELVRMFTRWTP